MATRSVALVLLASFFIYNVDCARILAMFPMCAPSHYILGSSLMKGLAEKGHDVTLVSCFGEKTPPNGTYRDIVLTGLQENFHKNMEEKSQSMFEYADTNPFLSVGIMTIMFQDVMEDILKHENLQRLLKSDEEFDVVIVEQFFNDGQKAVAKRFNAPLIIFSTLGANVWFNSQVGNPSPLSYVPDLFLEYSSQMTFLERVVNVLFRGFQDSLTHWYAYPKQDQMVQKYIPNPPQLKDVLYNASLVLLNSHQSINQAVPYVPCMVDVGGFHVKPPKALPQDLQQFLDGAKDGVIYFSMGSNLKSAQFPAEKRDAFLRAFAKLKQKVLWKWEEDTLPGQPKNVKLAKWLPQQDILAHPNVKVFMTHGGLLSTTETIYHGVPVLAIPVFGDQKLNAKLAFNNGFGLVLPYKDISEQRLTQALTQLIGDPKFKSNAKKRSELFHDRLVSPMETAVYWVEYVARHKGAPHLRVAALDLPWYKYHLLDVFALLAVILLISLAVLRYVTKKILAKICGKLCKKEAKKKKVH